MIKTCQRFLLAILLGSNLVKADVPESSAFIAVNWRNEDGLPHSIINSIVQGRDGYLWIGTYVGLVRFDGIRFLHYTPSDIPELGDGRIVRLFESRDGTLWVAIEAGRLVALKDGVARLHLKPGEPLTQPIVSMAEDGAGDIWFQSALGEYGRLTTSGIEMVGNTGGALNRSGRVMFSDQRGRVWIGTSDGLRLLQDGKLILPDKWREVPRGMVEATIAPDDSILLYRDQQLWRLTDSAVLATMDVPEVMGGAVNIVEGLDGRIWLAAGNGALYLRGTDGMWRQLPKESIPGASRVLVEDREGNVWRGSFGGGLARIRPRLFTVHELIEPGNDRYARSVSADSTGKVWAIVNSESIASVEPGQLEPQKWSGRNAPAGYRAIFVDRSDSVWLGGYGGATLYRVDEEECRAVRSPDDNPEAIEALFEDSHRNLWLGYSGGAGVGIVPDCDPEKWRDVQGIPFPSVRAIAEAPDGSMWFGTHYGGACRLKDGQWTQFTTRDGLPSDYVRCFLVGSDGNLWLGTLRGLCRVRDGKFVSITSKEGLWNDSISHLEEDEHGNVWASSFGGIFRVGLQMLNDFADGRRDFVQCVGYGQNDGLTSLECPGACQPAGTKSPDGRLWFPTVTGLVSVSPTEIKENKLVPPVWIEELSVDGETTVISHGAPAITVPPGKRRFDFRFTALSLSAPERVQFRHRLVGLDEEWTVANALRTAGYSYLPPGEYTFEVVACNNDGIWNEDGHSLQLIVLPFFWQTWWFKAGVGGALMLVVVFGVRRVERLRAQMQLERLEQKHAVEHERNRIAKDIHDDLGANLTQIVFLSQRAEGASHDQEEVEHWLRKIPATARRTIQSLDEIVWAINPKHDSLESLANYVSQFAQEHLTLAGIRCVLDVPTVLPHIPLSAEVRHNYVLTVRESLQNIVAHAAATEVTLALRLDEESLAIIVKDNGCGFDVSENPGSGNGLLNMQRRMEDMGGSFEMASRRGTGTTITLTLPTKRLTGCGASVRS